MSRVPLRVAVLGAGTVGREVIRGLLEQGDRLCADDGAPLVLTGVACRNLERARHAGIPADLLTDAPAHLVAAADTDVVVELMGGDEPARTLIAAALGAGKPVVTANKHVVAHHGPDLESVARRTGAAFRFEAAVAGGIPVLGPLASDLAANEITRVRGIVNGTTNFILSAMARDGRPYADVLAEAQGLGYAEADPRGDVEGDDAVNKLVILVRLAFGQWLDPRGVGRVPPTTRGAGSPGITGVTDSELKGAAALGLTIKLVAHGRRSGEAIRAWVLPTAVPAEGPLGSTAGVTNRIEIDADPLGSIGLSGPGAGGAATSSAVLGDLVAVARGRGSTWAGLAPAPARPGSIDQSLDERAWFSFIPRPSRGGRQGSRAVEALPAAEGLAVRTARLPFDEAREAVRSFLELSDDAGLTMYPIDD